MTERLRDKLALIAALSFGVPIVGYEVFVLGRLFVRWALSL